MPSLFGHRRLLLLLVLLLGSTANLTSSGMGNVWLLHDAVPATAEYSDKVTTIRLRSPDFSSTPMARGMALFSRNMSQRAAGIRILIEPPSTAPPGAGHMVVEIILDDTLPPGSYTLGVTDPDGMGVKGRIEAADPLGMMAGLGRMHRESQPDGEEPGVRLLLHTEPLHHVPRFAIRNAFGPIGAHGDSGAAERTGSRGWPSQQFRDEYFASGLLLGNNIIVDGMGSNQRVSLAQVAESGYNSSWHAYSTLAAQYDAGYCLAMMVNALNPDDWVSAASRVTWPFTHSAFARLGCPSDPPTRSVMLRERELYFENAPRVDWVLGLAGDIAGCRCDDCRPWGDTYLGLSRELAGLLKASHPSARFLANNTWLSPEESDILVEALREAPDALIDGLVYAPGSDAGSTYGFMPGLEEWQSQWGPLPPGTHPDDAPLVQRAHFASMKGRLAPSGQLTPEYVDITHWKSSQYGMEDQSHPVWLELYLRRSYVPRPRAYAAIIRASLALQAPEGGMIAYSEGIHDDLHKFILSRLLSDPDVHTVGEMVRQYYDVHAGRESAPPLAEATLRMEEWRRTPPGSDGLLQEVMATRLLIEDAVHLIPAPMRPGIDPAGWRVQLLRERAAIDLYTLLKFERQGHLHQEALASLDQIAGSSPLDTSALAQLVSELRSRMHEESPAMTELREEIRQLDDGLDAAIGLRFDTFSRLDIIDMAGLAWLAAEVESALAQGTEAQIRSRLRAVLEYEQEEPGGLWANMGTRDGNSYLTHPRRVRHYHGEGDDSLQERPSRRSYIHTHEEIRWIDMQFPGLDSGRVYRLTLTHPNPSPRFFSKDSPNAYRVLAGPQRLDVGTVRPGASAPQDFTFTLPAGVVSDGTLLLRLEAIEGECRSIAVSEVRLSPQ